MSKMNVSKLNQGYGFKGNGENLFKVQTCESGLPSKIMGLLKFDNGEFTIRFCDDWIICVGNGSMLIWKYSNNKKNFISSCMEYQVPHCSSGHNAKQSLIMSGSDNIIVTNEGHIRYWPRLSMPQEYLDSHIQNISHDECILVENLSNGAVVAVFRSMKFVIIDLRDSSESGISIKMFTQPRGFITGMGRYLSSFIVSPTNDGNNFKNIKVNTLLPEETEVLIMVDNNIDSLSVDVLFNGQYKKEIFNQDSIKKSIYEALYKESGFDIHELNIIFGNFDLCRNTIYALVKVQLREDWNYVLFTYNRKHDAIDTIVRLDIEITGEAELSVIVDESADNDESCLLLTLKDNHNIYVIEVLTGTVKCELNIDQPARQNAIVGWTCPTLSHEPNMIVIALTVAKQLLAIKQNINPFANQSFVTSHRGDTELDFNLSNASFGDWNTSRLSSMRPTALSTPLSKFDHKGDRLNESFNVSLNKSDVLNSSMTTIGTVDNICQDTSAFGIFKKSVVLYWLGYKNHAKRVLGPIIERAQVNNDISLPLFILQITREIIDEYPGKDPRWAIVISSQDTKGFLYSNKSLLLPQQLLSKKESLEKLILMLKENNVELSGNLGKIAPMSVCQSLYMQIHGSMLKSFGCSQVTWSVAHSIGFGAEMLEFVRVFNEIMTSENNEEVNQILAKCCQHILAMQRKLTPIDIVSQEVSLIPRFIRECADYLKQRQFTSTNAVDAKNTYTLLGKIISSCLKSSLLCRRQFEESFLSANLQLDSFSSSIAASCWITENQPIGVLDSIVDITHSLLNVSGGQDYNLFETAIDVITVLLDCFKYRMVWMEQNSSNSEEFKRLDEVYAGVRGQLIAKIVEVNGNLDTALGLADKFADFHWLTSICESLDNKSELRDCCHLEPYLKKWSAEGLSEYVLDWYQDRLKDVDQKSQGKMLAKIQTILEKIQKIEGTNGSSRMETSFGSQVIGKFLEKAEVQATRWLHDIETGEYSQAATSLRRLATAEELSVARRKTLLGLAKLSYLANTDLSTGQTEIAVGIVNRYLDLISFQEDIPASVIEAQLALTKGSPRQPVISTAQMVKLYLAATVSQDVGKTVEYFVQALSLMEFAWHNSSMVGLTQNEWKELLTVVWTEVVNHDDWEKITIDTSRDTSTLAKVYGAANDRGLSMVLLRPDLERLFDCDPCKGDRYGADTEFLIRGTLESLAGGPLDAGEMEHDGVCVDVCV